MKRILERNGYAVVAIETVQAAVEFVRSTLPDLLLTNVYLLGMTGRDAVRLLKERASRVAGPHGLWPAGRGRNPGMGWPQGVRYLSEAVHGG